MFKLAFAASEIVHEEIWDFVHQLWDQTKNVEGILTYFAS